MYISQLMVWWFLVHIHMYHILNICVHSSIDGKPLEPAPDTFSPGTGPIFIERLNCPPGDPDNYDEAYVGCLNEAILGQSQCSHNEDIGIRCTGMHVVLWTCIVSCMAWVNVVSILSPSQRSFAHVDHLTIGYLINIYARRLQYPNHS